MTSTVFGFLAGCVVVWHRFAYSCDDDCIYDHIFAADTFAAV